jgi:hypothetical protein
MANCQGFIDVDVDLGAVLSFHLVVSGGNELNQV